MCLYKEEKREANAHYARGQDEAKVPSKFRPSHGSTNFVILSNSSTSLPLPLRRASTHSDGDFASESPINDCLQSSGLPCKSDKHDIKVEV